MERLLVHGHHLSSRWPILPFCELAVFLGFRNHLLAHSTSTSFHTNTFPIILHVGVFCLEAVKVFEVLFSGPGSFFLSQCLALLAVKQFGGAPGGGGVGKFDPFSMSILANRRAY